MILIQLNYHRSQKRKKKKNYRSFNFRQEVSSRRIRNWRHFSREGDGDGDRNPSEIKWRIYTMRATVCTFTFGCKLHCKSWPVIWAAELNPSEREKSGIWSETKRRTGRFMGREMIYGAIVENNSRGSKDV